VHLITGQDINEATGNSDESSISDDETLMENCGTNDVAARANAVLLENDHDDFDADDDIDNDIDADDNVAYDVNILDADDNVEADDNTVDDVDVDNNSAEGVNVDDAADDFDADASYQANNKDEPFDDDNDGDDGVSFGGVGMMATETLDTINEDDDNDDDSYDSMLAKGHGMTVIDDSDGTVLEDSAAVAHGWTESIEHQEDEFMNALEAKEISKATMVAMLVEIGVFENEHNCKASNMACQNLLHEWGTVYHVSCPYCLLNRDQLLKKAKDLGIKRVHAGWKEQTILKRILEHHAAEGSL
jgi:hypothetical protein